jgi:hypothetical protein
MSKTAKVWLCATGVALAARSNASAQGVTAPQTFINFTAAAQPNRRDLTSTSTFTVYQEDATLSSTVHVGNGPYFELSVGRRVWRELAVGAAISYFKSTGTGSTVASIPSPVLFNHNLSLTLDSSDLSRKEVGAHIRFSWFVPVSDKIDIALSAGPSFVQVTQDLVTGTAADVPPGTQTINLRVDAQQKVGVGVNASFDGVYKISPTFGVGLLLQYAGGTVDLESAPDTAFGGFQGGIGIRFRF